MFKKIYEGDVFFTSTDGPTVCGPRLARLPDGRIICTFMAQTKIGSNDFVPMASYSEDAVTWSEAVKLWPELEGKKSAFVSVRNTADGGLSLGGKMWNIDAPGESFWSDEVGGMKENKLIYSFSKDGLSFPLPTEVEVPFYGAAEQPGGLMGDSAESFTIIYAPYPTIEQKEETDTCCLGKITTTDGGKTFKASKFGQIEPPCLYGESWLCRLSDGRLLASSWQTESKEHPDVYFISKDNGETFTGPLPMDFKGQTTALEPIEDGMVLIPYNQRKETPAGVYLALAKPDDNGFNMLENQVIWQAGVRTQSGTSGDFSEWTDFSFGEPHIIDLKDGTYLLCLWYEQPQGKGIRCVRLVRE